MLAEAQPKPNSSPDAHVCCRFCLQIDRLGLTPHFYCTVDYPTCSGTKDWGLQPA